MDWTTGLSVSFSLTAMDKLEVSVSNIMLHDAIAPAPHPEYLVSHRTLRHRLSYMENGLLLQKM